MKFTKFAIVTSLVVGQAALGAVLAPNKADAAVFNITFFDGATQVGTGSFEYTPGSTACISTQPADPLSCNPEFPGANSFDVTNPLTSLFTDISGTTLGKGSENYWYADAATSQKPGSSIEAKGSAFIQPENTWALVDNTTAPDNQLTMEFSSATSTSASGSFNASGLGDSFIKGTFTATVIPEPSTVLGVLAGLGFIASKKRKSSKTSLVVDKTKELTGGLK